MKVYLDTVALANYKSGNKAKKVFALRHIPSGLYFHSRTKRVYGVENNYYTAPYPMFRRTRGAFGYYFENFEHPEEWEVEEFNV